MISTINNSNIKSIRPFKLSSKTIIHNSKIQTLLEKQNRKGEEDLSNRILVVLTRSDHGVFGAKYVVEGSSIGDSEELECVFNGHLEGSRVVGSRAGLENRRSGYECAPGRREWAGPRPGLVPLGGGGVAAAGDVGRWAGFARCGSRVRWPRREAVGSDWECGIHFFFFGIGEKWKAEYREK